MRALGEPWRGPGWGWRGGFGWGGATIGIGLGAAAPYFGSFGYYSVDYIYDYPYYSYPSPCYLVQQSGPFGLRLRRVCDYHR
jgi:hypothetical protein